MPSKKPTPRTTSEQIAERAYHLFLARGGHEGYHVEDWLQAERELNGHHAAAEPAPKPARKKAATEKPAEAAPKPRASRAKSPKA